MDALWGPHIDMRGLDNFWGGPPKRIIADELGSIMIGFPHFWETCTSKW